MKSLSLAVEEMISLSKIFKSESLHKKEARPITIRSLAHFQELNADLPEPEKDPELTPSWVEEYANKKNN